MNWNKLACFAMATLGFTVGLFAQSLNVNGKTIETSSVRLKETIAGETVSLEQYKGEKGILVIFTCNTCPFVVGKEGGFAGWEKDYNNITLLAKAKGYGVVLVNSNEAQREDVDSPKEMIKHAKNQKYLAPYVIDKDHRLADLLQAKTTPHVYLFNGDNVLIYSGAIDNSTDPRAENIESYLVDALNAESNEIKIKETKAVGCSIKRVDKK